MAKEKSAPATRGPVASSASYWSGAQWVLDELESQIAAGASRFDALASIRSEVNRGLAQANKFTPAAEAPAAPSEEQ